MSSNLDKTFEEEFLEWVEEIESYGKEHFPDNVDEHGNWLW